MPKIATLEDGSSAQRGGLNHQAIEDYLKTIWALAQDDSPVSTSRLANARGVKAGSASGMIQRLDTLNLVHYEKHRGVTLTAEGEQIALEVIRHHRLIETYLIKALGFTWDEVHEEADILEHVISEKLEDRIAAVLGNPAYDPHGAPIPSKDGTLPQQTLWPLNQLSSGQSGVVGRIMDETNGDLLRYCASLGLIPGAHVLIKQCAPFDGPLTIFVNGDQDGNENMIGFKAAAHILIEKIDTEL